jgi:putative transposase
MKNKDYLKNEIGRIINRLVERYKPKEIVMEKLDFRGSNIGKKNNRLLSKFGKGILVKKLENISEEKGIEIRKINPAYTSQECPSCHYVSKNNRPKRDKFVCKKCGKKGHADVIGSKNIANRSSDWEYKKREEIRQLLDKKHNNWEKERGNSSAKDSECNSEKSKLGVKSNIN